MGKKAYILWLAMLVQGCLAWGQECDTSRWHVSTSVGSMAEAGYGRTQSLTWAAPHITYRPTDRLTVGGGAAAVGSWLQGVRIHGREPRSLSPRRQGTRMAKLWAEATYQTSEHTWVWGRLAYVGGQAQPLWRSSAVDVMVAAVSGGVAHEFASGNKIELHFHIVHDHYGTAFDALGVSPCRGFAFYDDAYGYFPMGF